MRGIFCNKKNKDIEDIISMNVFKRLYRSLTSTTKENRSSDYSPRLGATNLLYYGTSQPLAVAAVFRCVRLISESVANLPIQYLRLKNDRYEVDTSNRLNYLLSVQPNENMSAFDFWAQAVQHILLDGNAYILPMFSSFSMDYDRFVLLPSGSVSYDSTNNRYTIYAPTEGISGEYDENDIIHLKNLSRDGKNGLSVLSFARQAINIASTGDNETLNRFANGGNVRGIISNGKGVAGFGEYQDKELQQTAIDIDSRFSGGEHIVSLPGQVDFKQISLSSTDMQFLESRKFTVREICRFFGVHPSFVFDDTSNNYKSAEMANVAFLSNTLNPILRKIENELLRKLVQEKAARKFKFQFDRTGLYACDLDSRVKYQASMIQNGLCTINELRREENKTPIEGGDVLLVSANLKTIDQLQQEVTPTTNNNETDEQTNDNKA
ncbi:phage portal protein, HK97 family [Prevotella amnii]|uniref:Phage portal protein, HK97 family n=2 Tax=Prevotellaceae TaxID=171552 RepID=A0A134B5C8_9BACT|nr:phage portal protein, HK97 family [Prevotella amnii]